MGSYQVYHPKVILFLVSIIYVCTFLSGLALAQAPSSCEDQLSLERKLVLILREELIRTQGNLAIVWQKAEKADEAIALMQKSAPKTPVEDKSK